MDTVTYMLYPWSVVWMAPGNSGRSHLTDVSYELASLYSKVVHVYILIASKP